MNNPFLTIEGAVDRLYKEYLRHPKLIISYDFDSTVFTYPGTFEDIDANELSHNIVLELLRDCKRRGFYITMFTASTPDRYPRMLEYCEKLGITPECINANPIPLPFGNHGKIYYNILLDDRAGLGSAVETLQVLLKRIDENNE